MIPDHDLESRLRTGLRAAAEALPPAGTAGSSTSARSGPRSRQRRLLAVAASVTLVALGGAGVVALTGDDGGRPDVVLNPPADTPDDDTPDDDTPDDTAEVTAAGPGTDHPAGSAVVSAGSGAAVLTTYGADGQPGATVPLDPLLDVQTVVADRQGGWIACGNGGNDVIPPVPEDPTPTDTAPTSTVPAGTTDTAGDEITGETQPGSPTGEPGTYRFGPGQDPEPLPVTVMCTAGAMGVTDIGDDQVLVYQNSVGGLNLLNLTTGADEAVPVDESGVSIGEWSVGGGRLALLGDSGLSLWDLATGERLPVGPADLPVREPGASSGLFTTDLALSPDGTTLAVLVGDISPTSDVVVVDLVSGSEVFRRTVPVSLEGAEVSFDGASVAVGNFYDSYGPVRIYDLADGTERTVDAHGLVP